MGVHISKPHQSAYHHQRQHRQRGSSSSPGGAGRGSTATFNSTASFASNAAAGSRLDVTSITSKSAFAATAARRLSNLLSELFGHHSSTSHNTLCLPAPPTSSGGGRISSARSNSIPDLSQWQQLDDWDQSPPNTNINNVYALLGHSASRRGSVAAPTATNNNNNVGSEGEVNSSGDGQQQRMGCCCMACRRRLLYFNRRVCCFACNDTYCPECSEKNIGCVSSAAAAVLLLNAADWLSSATTTSSSSSAPSSAPASASAAQPALPNGNNIRSAGVSGNVSAQYQQQRSFAQFHAYPYTLSSSATTTTTAIDGVERLTTTTAGIGMMFMCKSCALLRELHPSRAALMQLRVRNLLRHLALLQIPTEFCTEKSDLVDLLLQYKHELTCATSPAVPPPPSPQQPPSINASTASALLSSTFSASHTIPRVVLSPAVSLRGTEENRSSSTSRSDNNSTKPLRRVASTPYPTTVPPLSQNVRNSQNYRSSSPPPSLPSRGSRTHSPASLPEMTSTTTTTTATISLRTTITASSSSTNNAVTSSTAASVSVNNNNLPVIAIAVNGGGGGGRPFHFDIEEEDDEGVVNDEEMGGAAQQRTGDAPFVNKTQSLALQNLLDSFMALDNEAAALHAIAELSVRQLKTALAKNLVTINGIHEKSELCQRMLALWRTKQHEKLISMDDERDENVCKICMDAPTNAVLLNCGHMLACVECSRHLAECPACRSLVVNVVRVFRM